ncbi:MAG TPA: sigma-70 family RNA polymerase sigma factor [Actinomycetota bacterium]
MTDAPSDEELLRRYLAGDPAAFESLVTRHRDRVFHLCLRLVRDPDEALDASQEAFLSVLRNASRFRGDAAFTTWLHRIAVNASHDVLRRRRRAPSLHAVRDEDGAEPEPGPASPDHADEVAGSIDAAEALARVPEEFRAALVLADVHDLPYDTIAEILEVPVGTVKSRVHRGRVALARALGTESSAAAEPPAPSGTSEEGR